MNDEFLLPLQSIHQNEEYNFLVNSKPEDLWIKDLEDFIVAYEKIINNLNENNKKIN